MLQTWLSLVDMGMKPALSREMARYTGGACSLENIWSLFRSIETIVISIAFFIAIIIFFIADWLASDWLQVANLSPSVVSQAFILMGIVVALQFVESLYTSCLAGLQKQVAQNIVISIMATARGFGAVAILMWVSPTIEAFFIWQGVVSLTTVIICRYLAYHFLPLMPSTTVFSWLSLVTIWRYATGMMGGTLLALLLTQVDKIMLSRMLPLDSFGYYVLAGLVASTVAMFTGPIVAAFYPKFTELLASGDIKALHLAYHQSAQLVSVFMGSIAIVLMVFTESLLHIWTNDPVLSAHISLLVTLLVLGNLLNGLMWVPYHMQLAYGWTSLSIKINLLAVLLLLPLLWLIVPRFGAIGAAWLWVGLNSVYIFIGVHLMYRKILQTEKWRWYFHDTFFPLITAGTAALLYYSLMPLHLGRIKEFIMVVGAFIFVFFVAMCTASLFRNKIFNYCNLFIKNKVS